MNLHDCVCYGALKCKWVSVHVSGQLFWSMVEAWSGAPVIGWSSIQQQFWILWRSLAVRIVSTRWQNEREALSFVKWRPPRLCWLAGRSRCPTSRTPPGQRPATTGETSGGWEVRGQPRRRTCARAARTWAPPRWPPGSPPTRGWSCEKVAAAGGESWRTSRESFDWIAVWFAVSVSWFQETRGDLWAHIWCREREAGHRHAQRLRHRQ